MKYVNTANAPATIGPYSQAISAHHILFISGQLGLEPHTMNLPAGIEAQAHQVLKNIQAILEADNKTFANVAKTTIFLANIEDMAPVNIIYADYFGDHRPARSCVAVANLPKNALIEIECIAL